MNRKNWIYLVSVGVLVAGWLLAGFTTAAAGRKRPAPPGDHLSIREVLVDPASGSNGQLFIKGDHFDFGQKLEVTLGELPAPLHIVFASPTMIVVDLPPGPPIAGDQLLTVSTGNGQSRNDEYDLTFGLEGPAGPPGPQGPQGPQGSPGVTDASGLVFYETDEFAIVVPNGSFSVNQDVPCDSGDVALAPAAMRISNHAVPSFQISSWSWERLNSETIRFRASTFDTCNENIGCVISTNVRALCLDATP